MSCSPTDRSTISGLATGLDNSCWQSHVRVGALLQPLRRVSGPGRLQEQRRPLLVPSAGWRTRARRSCRGPAWVRATGGTRPPTDRRNVYLAASLGTPGAGWGCQAGRSRPADVLGPRRPPLPRGLPWSEPRPVHAGGRHRHVAGRLRNPDDSLRRWSRRRSRRGTARPSNSSTATSSASSARSCGLAVPTADTWLLGVTRHGTSYWDGPRPSATWPRLVRARLRDDVADQRVVSLGGRRRDADGAAAADDRRHPQGAGQPSMTLSPCRDHRSDISTPSPLRIGTSVAPNASKSSCDSRRRTPGSRRRSRVRSGGCALGAPAPAASSCLTPCSYSGA